MKPKEEIRKELYEYLEVITPLTEAQKKQIKQFVIQHDQSLSRKQIMPSSKLDNLRGKLNKYIAKAKKLNSPKANLQAEGLAMCLNWLNQDDE
mgnify:CR=1 FL=1